MNCQKCNKEFDDESIFCKFCGMPLKKECPICHQLEWAEDINKGICRTEIEKIKRQKEDFIAKNLKAKLGYLSAKLNFELVIFSAVIGAIILTVVFGLIAGSDINESVYAWIAKILNVPPGLVIFFMPFFFFFILLIPVIIIFIKRNRVEKKIEQSFFNKFPGYQNMLKKASA